MTLRWFYTRMLGAIVAPVAVGQSRSKGNTMTLKELLGQSNLFLVFEKDVYNSGNYGMTKLKDKSIFAKSIRSYGPKTVIISYKTASDPYPVSMILSETIDVTVETNKSWKEQEYKDMLKNPSYELHHDFYIGADPEIFIEDENEQIIPAFNFLGSKDTPDTYNDRYGVQQIYWDGFQAEFNTKAHGCLAWHCDGVQSGLKTLLGLARKHNPNAKLSTKTTADIPPKLLVESKEEHVQFGCMPSLNAYDMKGITLPGREVPFRSAGGHIHFGFSNPTPDRCVRMVKALDAILGVACVSLFEKYDDPRRRVMYGLAGEYRMPKHGLEYRVLSNAWLIHPAIKNLVFDLARRAAVFGDKGYMDFWKGDQTEIIECINNCDAVKAREIMERNKSIFEACMKAAYHSVNVSVPFKCFMEGIDSFVSNPKDIENNWDMNKQWITHCDGPNKNWTKASISIANKNKIA